jgi:hypothetical protein
MGEARSALGVPAFPLLGIAPVHQLQRCGEPAIPKTLLPRNPLHTHFIGVPGMNGAIKSQILARTVTDSCLRSPSDYRLWFQWGAVTPLDE